MKSRFLKISGKVFVFLFVLILAGIIALQTSAVQSWIVAKVTDSLTEQFGGRLTFSSVTFQPFNHILIKDVVLSDSDPYETEGVVPVTTVLTAKSIHASFSLWGLIAGDAIHIKQLQIKAAEVSVVQEPDGVVNLVRIFGSGEDDGGNFGISLNKLSLTGARVKYISFAGDGFRADAGVEFHASNLKFETQDGNISASGIVEGLSLQDTSGFEIRKFQGRGSYGSGKVTIRDFVLDDGLSRINAPLFQIVMQKDGNGLYFPGMESYVSAKFSTSRIAAASAAIIDNRFQDDPTVLEIGSLEASGYFNDILLTDFKFKEASTGIEAQMSGSLMGLGTGGELLTSLKLDKFRFTTGRLDKLLYRYTGEHNETLRTLTPGRWYTLRGNVSGPLNRLSANATLTTSGSGSVSAYVDLRNFFDATRTTIAHVEVNTRDLDLGSIFETEYLQSYSLHAKVDARLSDKSESYFAYLSSNDPGLDFELNLSAMARANGRDTLRVSGEVRNINLNAYVPASMPLTGISMKINGGGESFKEAYDGRLSFSDIILKSTEGTYNAGNSDFVIENKGDKCIATLRGSVADADFEGSCDPVAMVKDLLCHTLKRELPVIFSKESIAEKCPYSNYHFKATTGDMSEMMPYLFPGLYISSGTSLEIKANGTGTIDGSLSSVGIASQGYYARDINANFDNRSSKLSLYASVSEIGVNDVFLQNDILTLESDDNRISMAILYDNHSNPESKAEFFADATLYRNTENDLSCRIEMSESDLMASGLKWAFAPCHVTVEPDYAEVVGFRAECEDQLISINGMVSDKFDGQMEVLVQNFKLNTFNPLLHPDYRMDGTADGRALIISPVENSFNLMANLHSIDTHIGGRNYGNFNMASVLDPDENRLDISFNNTYNEKVTLAARGSYDLDNDEIHINVHADSLSMGCINPIMVGILSDAGGFISGDLSIDGSPSRPELSSKDIRIEDGWVVVDYTHVPYNVSGGIGIDSYGLHFLNNPITDRYGNKGVVSGKIGWDHYDDWDLDMMIEFDSAEVIDIKYGADQMINGNVFATGYARFSGPTNNVLCDFNLRSSGPGTFIMPLDSYEEDSVIDLLSFKQKDEEETDNFLFMARKTKKVHEVADNLRFKIKLDITPDLVTNIEMDKSTGSAIVARGNGNIDIVASTSPALVDLNGDYTLESGDFHFVVLGVANRTFDIKSGSAVHFNGDLDDTDLNIDASYITKASISNLIADTTAVATRRNVECGINIGNTFANPSLSFSINVPDLDPTMKARVEGALNTDDKVQKQFIALLVTGGFIPDEESGIVFNSSNIFYSNFAGIMAGQLNNILQKFNIPLDLGLSYQANDGGTDIFDVAVSTELFNNRVVVNGSVGNRDNTKRVGATSTTSDVVGDVDIEIKLDQQGQVRMNMFSHSADEYTNYLDNSQRNGVGITYQKEFNNVKEFFRDIFRKKKNKEQEPAKETEQVTVTMD